jgi:hypothetical protein
MLHLENSQAKLEIVRGFASLEVEGHDQGEEINPYFLGETIKEWVENELLTYENVAENFDLWLMLTDIGSLYRVNWREIADSLISQVKEEVNA